MFKIVSLIYVLAVAASHCHPVPDSDDNIIDVFEKRQGCGMMGCGAGMLGGSGIQFSASNLFPNSQFIGSGFKHSTTYPDITFSAIHGGSMAGMAPSVPAQGCDQGQDQSCSGVAPPQQMPPQVQPAPPAPPAPPAQECDQSQDQSCQGNVQPTPPAPYQPAPPAPPAQECDQSQDQGQDQSCQGNVQPAPPQQMPPQVQPAPYQPAPSAPPAPYQPAPSTPPAPPAQECDQNQDQSCQGNAQPAPPAPPAPPAQGCDQGQGQYCPGMAAPSPSSFSFSNSQSQNTAVSHYKDSTVYVNNKDVTTGSSSSNSNTNLNYTGQ
ncbi:hypothetical protein GGI25_006038 [Coemansia spiralis]|uniref:Uncharacterized protein n=1 Tax=Coemansia spiralis TaxID=417178 RepID=A0A9W8KVP2_9FUNG|nr:hypothetical protein BX070DRAFT_222373 [Coemansia spiralis]KAJ2618921.1 hypothetical protein GGI26_006237 [Coemansia sp. RSA 1358]KAJ2669828.1 hypothetical protein GGI25_006038 [Coemansia spiralis]